MSNEFSVTFIFQNDEDDKQEVYKFCFESKEHYEESKGSFVELFGNTLKEETELKVISTQEYEHLMDSGNMLAFLEARGVDNWHGYGYPPERENYDSDEEYEEAYEDAINNI